MGITKLHKYKSTLFAEAYLRKMATAVGSAATVANPGAIRSQISKELRAKANDFLNSRRNANNLLDIIGHFEVCVILCTLYVIVDVQLQYTFVHKYYF